MTKPRLLIIDDEKDLCELLAEVVENHFQVQCLTDHTDISSFFLKNSFDLILTDLCMPGLKVDEIISIARQSQKPAPVILFTGSSDQDPKVQKCLNLGASGYISKPIKDISALNQTLLSFLKK